DTQNPNITTQASNSTVECDGSGNTADLNAWLASHGGAAANDACSGTVTDWTNDFSALSNGCGSTGSATVTFTAHDDCGHTATTTATFTIEDTQNPNITTQASNSTVECDGSGNTADLNAWLASHGGAAANDACSGTVTDWTNDFSALSNGCGSTGSATVTFTAHDDCGHTATTTATFTIEDTQNPNITTQASNSTVECDGSGNTADLNSWLASHGGAAANDACSGTVTDWTNDFSALSNGCGSTGSATVTFTAHDDCGHTATTTATFTIEDTQNPNITTQASNSTVECDGSGNTADLNAWLASHGGAAANDACSGTVTDWTNDFSALSNGCGSTGSATVTFTAHDDCGHTATTTATFTIEDTQNPNITTQASNSTVECDGSGNTADLNAWLASHGGAAANDACSGTVTDWTNDFSALSNGCGSTGSATVTFTAHDDCGHTATTTATFTIEDTQNPNITTQASNSTVECDGSGNTADLNSWLASHGGAAANDACSGTVTDWTNDFSALSNGCGSTGSATVTFTAHDDCGHTATTTATFTIEDTQNPNITTQASNSTVECDGSGNTADLNAWLASHGGAAANDACSGTVTDWTNDFSALSNGCGSTGSATVTFTAHDDCGHTATTTATFTIEDTQNPNITTQASNSTVECDGSGNTADLNSWLASHGGAAANDACSGTVTDWTNDFSALSNGCGSTGSATVTFTAHDDCGHTATTTATFTIEDTQNPNITTQASNSTVECDGSGNTADLNSWLASHGGAAANDACSGTVTDWTNDFSALSNGCGSTGSATVTFTAHDDCGHTATTTATFTIEDTQNPNITTQASNSTVECDGSGNTADLNAWLASHGGAAANDACSGTVTDWTNDFSALSNGCGSTGSATVTFTAHDDCGHTATTTATFTIEDTQNPNITTQASNSTVECDGSGNTADLNAWLASHGGAAANDACSGTVTDWTNDFSALSNGCGSTGSATVTFTAHDDCGHTATTTATFTIEDTQNPNITTQASNSTVECDGSGNTADLNSWLASHGGAAANDACSGTVTDWTNDFSALSNGCGSTGSATVTFTAHDDCGHTATTTATFTIEDTQNPNITTQASNSTVECDGSGNTADLNSWLASHGGAAANDACSGTVTDWTNDFSALSNGCGSTGSATVTFTAHDDCGHTATTTATFTIEDTQNPNITTQASNSTVECDGSGNTADLNSWLASHGGAAANDACSGTVTDWTNDFSALSNGCGSTGSATVTFTAHDDCGHTATTTATFTIEDTQNPNITTQASNSTVECDGSGNTADLNSWLASHGGAAANDACSGTVTDWTNDFSALSNGCGSTGSATVTFTAHDDCGHTATTTATFTIEDTTVPTFTAPANTTIYTDANCN